MAETTHIGRKISRIRELQGCARKGALINILSKYWACVLKPIINRPICAGNQQQRKKHVGKGISQVAIKPATE